MSPLIGITASVITPTEGKLERHGQNSAYVHAVLAAGGTPVIIPTYAEPALLTQLAGILDGLLLAGGDDIAPHRYGEEPSPHLGPVTEARDEAEFGLLERINEAGRPVLAICRGIQLLNVSCGGSLYQDLRTDRPEGDFHGDGTLGQVGTRIEHVLRVEDGSRLAAALGTEPLAANSYHHQGIKKIGARLRPTAWAEDGLIEAIELEGDRFVVGVQCHPESLIVAGDTRWPGLFRAFVKEAEAGGAARTAPRTLLVR